MHTMYESSKKKRKQGVLGLAFLVKMYYYEYQMVTYHLTKPDAGIPCPARMGRYEK